MTQKRRAPKFVSPPLDPKAFHDPFKRRQKRRARHVMTKALKTLCRFYVE